MLWRSTSEGFRKWSNAYSDQDWRYLWKAGDEESTMREPQQLVKDRLLMMNVICRCVFMCVVITAWKLPATATTKHWTLSCVRLVGNNQPINQSYVICQNDELRTTVNIARVAYNTYNTHGRLPEKLKSSSSWTPVVTIWIAYCANLSCTHPHMHNGKKG